MSSRLYTISAGFANVRAGVTIAGLSSMSISVEFAPPSLKVNEWMATVKHEHLCKLATDKVCCKQIRYPENLFLP